jgi:lipopolysaccharide biosynthesis glycosyltransferase
MVESVELVLRAVADGRPRAAVRETWARFWDPDVRAAQRLWQDSTPDLLRSDAPLEAAARIRSAGRRYGPTVTSPDAVHVSLATDQNLLDQLPVTIEAIVRNTSRPLRISILTRGVGTDVERSLAAAHPSVELTFFPCDTVDHGGRLIKHITASTMDRLLLPEILDDVARTVYIDIDALVLDDIGQLFDWDLSGAPVAARTSERSVQSIAVHVSASLDPEPARELRDAVLHRAGHAVLGINAGVLVLDLERMRQDDFCRTFVPWVSRYHLNDQEVVEFYAGDQLSVLPERWNAWPYKEVVENPAVVHWVGPFKPWRATVTRDQHRWAHYARLADERRAALDS